jgi:hypothetical protein
MAGNVCAVYVPNLLADGICGNIQFGSIEFVKTSVKLDLFFVSRFDSVHEEKLISVANYMLVASKSVVLKLWGATPRRGAKGLKGGRSILS